MSKLHSFCDKEEIKKVISKEGVRVHFVGALGIGMRGLLELSHSMGMTVTGSDSSVRGDFVYTDFGVKITPHSPKAVTGADLVVYSLAISEDNPELACADWLKIPAVSRAEYLGILMDRYKMKITVSGSHGKSTATAMLHSVFSFAALSPTVLCGANLPHLNSPLALGRRDIVIAEACEYKDSFLHLNPSVALFLNLELDHTDYFSTLDALKSSFLVAMNKSPLCIVNGDDENLRALLPRVKSRVVTFGKGEGCDVRMVSLRERGGYYSFGVVYKGKRQDITLSVPGAHNCYNALGVLTVSLALGLPFPRIKSAISGFFGIERRLQALGRYKSHPVYYDYAHHPTEIRAAISTVSELHHSPVTVIFKPHTYSRTKALLSDFASALSLAERVIVLEISAVREREIEGVSAEVLCEKIGERAVSVLDSEALGLLRQDGTPLIVMGAASVDGIIREISENIE